MRNKREKSAAVGWHPEMRHCLISYVCKCCCEKSGCLFIVSKHTAACTDLIEIWVTGTVSRLRVTLVFWPAPECNKAEIRPELWDVMWVKEKTKQNKDVFKILPPRLKVEAEDKSNQNKQAPWLHGTFSPWNKWEKPQHTFSLNASVLPASVDQSKGFQFGNSHHMSCIIPTLLFHCKLIDPWSSFSLF